MPECCGEQMVGLQYRDGPAAWDGFSEWICPACNRRIGRFTGRELADGEYEDARERFSNWETNDG